MIDVRCLYGALWCVWRGLRSRTVGHNPSLQPTFALVTHLLSLSEMLSSSQALLQLIPRVDRITRGECLDTSVAIPSSLRKEINCSHCSRISRLTCNVLCFFHVVFILHRTAAHRPPFFGESRQHSSLTPTVCDTSIRLHQEKPTTNQLSSKSNILFAACDGYGECCQSDEPRRTNSNFNQPSLFTSQTSFLSDREREQTESEKS